MRRRIVVLILAVCISSSFAFAVAPGGYVKVWEDTFDGTSLDTSNWTVGLIDPGTNHKVPGAAGRYLLGTQYSGYITAEDVIVDGGNLTLQNQKRSYTGTDPAGNYDYTSGWIMSMHKVFFNKGYLEMRAKYPSGDKVWPAFWLIAEDLTWGPEWDMFEYFGYRDNEYDRMDMALAYGTYPNINWLGQKISNYDGFYDCETWHVYGFEWTAGYAKFYIDGVEVYHMENTIGSSWPDEDMYIVLNNGVRTDSPDTTTIWPNEVVVDYIELYQPDNECGNGVCELGEDCHSCSADCIGVTGGKPSGRYCCGDGTCEVDENETNCAVDCGGFEYCGNGTCDLGEDGCNCPSDCGPPPSTEGVCYNGADDDCDGRYDCSDPDCTGDPACPSNYLINPNFELDGDGNQDLTTRPITDCLNWNGWEGSEEVVPSDHSTALMEAHQNLGSIWQDTIAVAYPDTTYLLIADIKSLSGPGASCLLNFETGGDWANDEETLCVLPDSGWQEFTAVLDTAASPVYAGRQIVVGIRPDNGDVAWTNVRLSIDNSGSYCGDGTCDPGEDQCNCSDDCGTPPSTETSCSDGIDNDCDTYTDCDDSDCDGDPACPSCGDGTCDPGEDQCNCPEDCGTPPSTETSCTDGIDNDCDTYTDCDDSDCDGDPACPECLPKGAACTDNSECCSGTCLPAGKCK
jgi:beta-glucanase (GH16 family)